MDDENGRSPDPGSGPALITANQVAAWNMAWYRKAAGLTQAQLAELAGWSKSAVSELERSWSGKRPREFDAQSLTVLALALGVPLIALFLPPEDADDYVFPAGAGRVRGMEELTALAMPDSDEDSAVLEKYRKRLSRTVERYLDPSWAADVAAWLSRREPAAKLAARADRMRRNQQIALEHAAEWARLAGAIEDELRAAEGGREL